MTRILVTTDFSENSIAGLRFAIQLASQASLELIFLHVPELWKGKSYRNHTVYTLSSLEKETKGEKEFDSFVRKVYHSMNIVPERYQCITYSHIGIVFSIIDYAVNNNCEYICISTHGAGNIEKFLGTTTGDLIRQSPVPVLCIPKNYVPHPMNRLLYASDLAAYEKEMRRVTAFARLVGAEIHVLHLSTKQKSTDETTSVDEWQKRVKHSINFHHQIRDLSKSLFEELDEAVGRLHPSILIMFTEQNRSVLENLFLSSKTEGYSFITKVPLLAFKKT